MTARNLVLVLLLIVLAATIGFSMGARHSDAWCDLYLQFVVDDWKTVIRLYAVDNRLLDDVLRIGLTNALAAQDYCGSK